MATILTDEEKKKQNSFGDAAAASSGATQVDTGTADSGTSSYGDQMRKVGGFIADVAKSVVGAPGYYNPASSALGVDGKAAPDNPMAKAATPTPQAQGNPNAQTDVQRGGSIAPGSVPGGAPMGTDVGYGIRRIDTAGKSPLFTNMPDGDNTALMGRGAISEQNQNAAQSLSDKYTNEARGALALEQYNREVAAANAINNTPTPKDTGGFGLLSKESRDKFNASYIPHSISSQKVRDELIAKRLTNIDANATQDALQGHETARATMREGSATQRAAMQEQGLNSRFGMSNQLAAQELQGKQVKLGFEAKAAAQIQKASDEVMAAETPEERKKAMETLAVIQGRYSPKDQPQRMQLVNLPDTTTPDGMVKLGGGQAVLRENADGTVTRVPLTDQAQGVALPPGMKRQIGTSNGRPVYEDMNGKQVIPKG